MRGSVSTASPRLWLSRTPDLLILAVPAWASPLQVWATNPVGVNYPGRLLLLGLVLWAVAAGTYLSALALGARRGTVLSTTFLAAVLVTEGGSITRVFGLGVGLVLIASMVGIAGYLVSRRGSHSLVTTALVGACLVLAAGPAHSLITTRGSLGDDITGLDPPALELELVETPHIFVVVTDGYVGKVSMREDFGIESPQWETALVDRGFEVPESAWTSYATTEASLPSMLDMSYPIEEGPGINPATTRVLHEKMGGDNRLLAELKQSGYRFVMIEAGWSGSSCGPAVDDCVTAPLVDEATFLALYRTVFSGLVLERLGYAFGIGTLRTMDWLGENARRISMSRTPHVVFAHLMAPHPPFFLDPSCRHRYSDELSGLFFGDTQADLETRKEGYLAQAACVDRFFTQLAEEVSGDSIVVLVSDHGSDSRDQLIRHPGTWDKPSLIERMNVLLAVKTGPECSIGDHVVLPNLFRRILSCLSREPIGDLVPRLFKYGIVHFDGEPSPVIEVEPELVRELVGGRAG